MNTNRYPEKNGNYSPSSIYTAGSGGNKRSFQRQQNFQPQENSFPRRRTERFKKETSSLAERQVKQNDMIISLLREIRDRLPPPPATGVQPDVAMADLEDDNFGNVQVEDPHEGAEDGNR